MRKQIRSLFLFCLLLICCTGLIAQDSTVIRDLKVMANKTGDGHYTLTFNAAIADDWQVYAPDQVFDGAKMAELKFSDSAVQVAGNFTGDGTEKKIQSPYFGPDVRVYEGALKWEVPVVISGTVPQKLSGSISFSYGKADEFLGSVREFQVELEGGVAATTRILIPSIDIKNPVNDCGDDDTEGKSLGTVFLLGLLGGLIALLTPCVFPLIPLTVSFFTQRSGTRRKGIRNAVTYGFFIFLIYVLLSLPFHLFLNKPNPEILNAISTNVWLNITFFVVFVVFAISFFGYFEIGLPGSIANRSGSRSGMGIGGIFFMALTLAIVSFSCTGPILGSLLAGTFTEGAWPLTMGLAGFGLALAFPFALFAMFPGWLQSLPKSGGWLNSVKVVLGFLELAMAIKFLSNADLVKQWGLLKREVFMGIWVALSLCIVLYLLGLIRFPHDSRIKWTRSRWAFIILFIVTTFYLAPGVTNTRAANLHLISGFPPPLCYSVYKEPVNCKRGFEPLRDYEVALMTARKENKPILIDFTGWACVNCRRMEENVWTDPQVDSLMRNNFVVVSLYVDEKIKLPLSQQIQYTTKSGDVKSIVRVGDKWATFQFENFNILAQPLYAIISSDEKALTKTKAYTPGAGKFADWLRCGLDAFRKRQAGN